MSKNLKELLGEYNIVIPMLQRDYAQGRKSQERIAKEFLEAIFKTLNKSTPLHIDFIYGYKDKDEFILIDGQQRITTLWLLHFFIYKQAEKLGEIKELLSKFSYNTRQSSAKFCKNLLNKDFDIRQKPSEAIINKGGIFENSSNLQNDPTIKAMLHMLDLIFEQSENKKNIGKMIENLDKITFDLFDMGEFDLGEDLYIKMNARGKQLSQYENLKAYIEKDFKIKKNNDILQNIDTNWSDYFFDDKNANKFDDRFRNFLHYATIFFSIQKKDKKIENLKNLIEDTNHVIDEFYSPLQDIDNLELLNRLINFLILNCDSPNLYRFKSNFFDKPLSRQEVCYFFSLMFCILSQDDQIEINDAINDYLRVCKHFIENNRLDQEEHINSFFDLFEHLSKGIGDIYQYLIKNSKYPFNSNIYTLEVRKARLILESRNGGNNWETILNQTSDNEALVGWVDFLLDFSDEKFEYKSYKDSNFYTATTYGYDSKYKNPVYDKFEFYTSLTMQILNKDKEGFLHNNLPLFQRALLCIGNFGFYATNYFYGNYMPTNFRDREAWNWLLSGVKNDDHIPYFKELLDRIGNTDSELKDKMQCIIDNTNLSSKNWWEQLLIGQKGLFEFIDEARNVFQKSRRIRYSKDDDKIYNVELLPGIKNRKNVKNLLDYGFYLYCKEKEVNVSEYNEEQNDDEVISHFNIEGRQVICDSKNSNIKIGDIEFNIQLAVGNNIFDEFNKICKKISSM